MVSSITRSSLAPTGSCPSLSPLSGSFALRDSHVFPLTRTHVLCLHSQCTCSLDQLSVWEISWLGFSVPLQAVCTPSKDFGLILVLLRLQGPCTVPGTEQERTGPGLSLKGRGKGVRLVLRKDNSCLRGRVLGILGLPAPPRSDVFRRSRESQQDL